MNREAGNLITILTCSNLEEILKIGLSRGLKGLKIGSSRGFKGLKRGLSRGLKGLNRG